MYYDKKNNINIRVAKIWLYKYEEKKKLPLSIYIFNFSVYVTWACSSFSFLCILPLPYKKSWLVTINLSGKAGEYIKKAKKTITNLEMIGCTRVMVHKFSSTRNCPKILHSPTRIWMDNFQFMTNIFVHFLMCFDWFVCRDMIDGLIWLMMQIQVKLSIKFMKNYKKNPAYGRQSI